MKAEALNELLNQTDQLHGALMAEVHRMEDHGISALQKKENRDVCPYSFLFGLRRKLIYALYNSKPFELK